jgi:peptide/nickel transport system substrate-binding protein
VTGNTITFTFPVPHCDMPFAAALPTTAAVPAIHDTRLDYDKHPWSDGPYMVDDYQPGRSLTLTRNNNWDPEQDPVRAAYPDGFTFDLNLNADSINRRLIADQGADETALSWADITPSTASQVTGEVTDRAIVGPTPTMVGLFINTQRVTQLAVRQALNTAIDKNAVGRAAGGDAAVAIMNTIDPPTVFGWHDDNVFDVGPDGDPDRARSALGAPAPRLTLCAPDAPVARSIKDGLARAGFVIDVQPASHVDSDACDLTLSQWRAAGLDGSQVLPPLLDRLSYHTDALAAEIDRASAERDVTTAVNDWIKLDHDIMVTDAPLVPLYNVRTACLRGGGVDGTFLSPVYGAPSLNTVYAK